MLIKSLASHKGFFILLIVLVCACSREEAFVEIVTTDSNIIVSGNTCKLASTSCRLNLEISTKDSWRLSSNAYWCISQKIEGRGNDIITIDIEENIARDSREAELVISLTSGEEIARVEIIQDVAIPNELYVYKIPVIFHLLYNTSSSKLQNPSAEWIESLLRDVNKIYDNCGQSVNVDFVLAQYDPSGDKLAEAGIERVQVSFSSINSSNFMGFKTESNKYNYLMWDPKQYLNIFIYTFSDSAVLGVSHAPYLIEPYSLEGLDVLGCDMDSSKLQSPQCVSINNTYIYNHQETYSSMDVVNTLAHELGHFLGLRHVFSESTDPLSTEVEDTDFCTDTPTYDRTKYTAWMAEYMKELDVIWTAEQYERLCQRTNPLDGKTYTSTNIMDYSVCNPKDFSAQQAERMNFVLLHSPFIPGPKIL